MVLVTLQEDWTDDEGVVHSAGETVDVDAATLAHLQASGKVEDNHEWVGPTGIPGGLNRNRPPGPDLDEDEW